MLKVGLTGGIGSGKSTVAELFAGYAVPVIDTDVIARQLTAEPAIIEKLRTLFGDSILTGDNRLDRRALATLVFRDSDAKQQLENLLHPLIRQQLLQALEASRTAPYTIVVVPLLLETDFHTLVDRILVVDLEASEQIRRVLQRDGRSEAEVRRILDQQITRAQRLQRADDVIDNSGNQQALVEQVKRLHQQYLQG